MAEFLKCDAPGCDHREDVPDITEAMVGMPCPKCGASLLTREDWDVWVKLFRPMVKALTTLGVVAETDPDNTATERLSLNYHDGETKVKVVAR